MICELTGMEVANASMYDGSTAAAEAAMMAVRLTGRSSVVVARSVHPEYREVLATYAHHQNLPLSTCSFGDNGRLNLRSLEKAVTSDTDRVRPDPIAEFLRHHRGRRRHRRDRAQKRRDAGGVDRGSGFAGHRRAAAQADIIAMEAQSFGVPLGFGGPYCGVIATREQFVRQMPGRLAGQTTDRNGKRGFVLTLATREQHIRREKATSNICTNQALVALMVNIFMTIYGKVGLKELANKISPRRLTPPRSSASMPKCCSPARRVSMSLWCRPAKILTPSTAASWDTRLSAACP